jgi:hypothetical protein
LTGLTQRSWPQRAAVAVDLMIRSNDEMPALQMDFNAYPLAQVKTLLGPGPGAPLWNIHERTIP